MDFNVAFDYFGLLRKKFRHMILNVVRGQMVRLIGTGLIFEYAERCTFTVACIKPIIAHESLRPFYERHEIIAHYFLDFRTVLRFITVTANMFSSLDQHFHDP